MLHPLPAALLCALSPLAGAQAQSATQAPPVPPADASPARAPYRVLDRVEGAHIDLALLPVRPLHRTDSGELYAVDSERSELLAFDASGAERGVVRVPWGPVAVTSWRSSSGGPEALLVVCRGSHSLAVIDAASLQLTGLLPLPAEPADIVIEPSSNHAFVAGSALDVVVEIDVAAGLTVAEYAIPSKRPTFLAVDGSTVLVAPMLSGNNSMADTGDGLLDVGAGRVLDLEDPAQALQGLPDHDLFRITPGAGTAAVATDTGAVLFAVGVHPSTGQVWQLGTEANNKDPLNPGEPAIRGIFIENRVALLDLSPGSIVAPSTVLNLDDTNPAVPGVQYSAQRSVGQPYALAFDGQGHGYVAGLLTSNVVELDANGTFVREWDVGLNPRGLAVDDAGETLYVYAWNRRRVEVFDLAPANPSLASSLDLGPDPTADVLAEGRRQFFDGTRSLHGNASCASCHIETESDFLIWDLGDLPYDDKGALATQTLRGIADLGPFHWRGERPLLEDFNDAFDGLMGDEPLNTGPGSDFEAFEAYLFSLEQPANPNQDRDRVVAARGTFKNLGKLVQGDAVLGQDQYFDVQTTPGVGSCNACHTLPTGTANEVTLDEPDLEIPRRNHFVVASFNGIWRKEQSTLETVILAGGVTEQRPTLGSGVAASGLKDSLLDFVRIPLFQGSDQLRRNIAAFVHQADSGLAPAVHASYLLRGASATAQGAQVRGYLLRQAAAENCDVAVIGSVDLGSGAREIAWTWDRASGLFSPDDSTVAPRPLDFFIDQALAGTGSNLILGLPVGLAERFATDRDLDGLLGGDELALGTDPGDPDTDGDGDLDGSEVANGGDPLDPGQGASDTSAPVVSDVRVVFVTGSVAKIQFRSNELTTWTASWTSGQQSGSETGLVRDRNHTVLLSELRGNNKLHNVSLVVSDLAGNSVVVPVTEPVRTDPAIPTPTTVFRDPSLAVTADSGGTLAFTLSGKARIKFGALTAGRQLRVAVFVNGELTQPLAIGTISGGDGITSVDITETGLMPGDVVEVAVSTLRDAVFSTDAFFSFPDTPTENRRFGLTYTGVGP